MNNSKDKKNGLEANTNNSKGKKDKKKGLEPNTNNSKSKNDKKKDLEPNTNNSKGKKDQKKGLEPNTNNSKSKNDKKKDLEPNTNNSKGKKDQKKGLEPNTNNSKSKNDSKKCEIPNINSEKCVVCGACTNFICSRCKLAAYCSLLHQHEHWPEHKHRCNPFSEANDNVLGRYLVAKYDIEAEQVIFREDPVIVGPKWYHGEMELQSDIFPCVGCYKPCVLGTYSCPNCNWPICKKCCKGNKQNDGHSLECKILCLGPGPKSSLDMHNYYRQEALLVLRCLLLQQSHPQRWNSLMEMQSHQEERIDTELYKDAESRVVSYLQKNFLKNLKNGKAAESADVLQVYNNQMLHRICGIIETNYMCIQLMTGMELSGLFRMACMMEHSCQPNVYFQFNCNRDYTISVVAGCKIKRGEHLKISYTNVLWGTQMRNHHLSLTKHFTCSCLRCRDPTECGTYFSALRCLGDVNMDCDGIQLPVNPIDEQTDWKCNKCAVVVNAGYVANLLNQVNEDVDTVLESQPSLKDVNSIIARLSKFLHPNHYHLFNLKHTLVQLYGAAGGNNDAKAINSLTLEQLDYKERLCRELYDICRSLDPCLAKLSIYAAILLFELQRTFKERANRLIAEKQPKTAIAVYVAMGRETIMKAVQLLAKELDTVAGKKLNDKFNMELLDLDRLDLMYNM